jgi:hypothetical protein
VVFRVEAGEVEGDGGASTSGSGDVALAELRVRAPSRQILRKVFEKNELGLDFHLNCTGCCAVSQVFPVCAC